MNEETLNILSSIIANATPLVIASIGETISERVGVVNLSLDGSIVLSAMAGFGAALFAQNNLGIKDVMVMTNVPLAAIIGLLVAMLVGALMALIIAIAGIELKQDQVAIGFVLTLLGADLAQFLGDPIARQPGPQILKAPIPLLQDIPLIGPIFFKQTLLVYFSYILIIGVWYWLFRTRQGLALRAVGERPTTAYARGTRVNRLRYIYVGVGGALVGLAGASYSLSVKAGWTTPPSMAGDGWIALAIVIFGGWHPFRVALGAYLFAALRAFATIAQRSSTLSIPVVILNAIPWVLMIITLLLVSSGAIERLLMVLPRPVQKFARNFLRSDPPAALGTRFDPE